MFKDKKFLGCSIGLLLLVLVVYSNHFHNSFHFDDSHSIQNNGYLRSLHNIPLFFKSGTTFSTLPSNQTYRPMLSAFYAITYYLGGGDVFWFHLIIFSFFLVLGVMIFLLSFKIFDITIPSPNNKYFALLASGWFMLSTCNSDTINYISSSSDSLSTCWLMMALCFFIYLPKKRKFGLYLIPLLVACLFKPSAIVFPILLGCYLFLFENAKNDKAELFSAAKIKKILLIILPSLVLCIVYYKLQQRLNSPLWKPSASLYHYLITQPFVSLYYFFTFYFPFGLSVDPDWVALTSIIDLHFLIGIAFLAAIVFLTIYYRKKTVYYPILFGLIWFFIALLPSSLVPLEEVMNDHRAFFSGIGLVIASTWILRLLFEKVSKSKVPANLLKTAFILILLLNAFGTFERNKVWATEESLWYDVTVKSPGNGRGLMNYGNVLMSQGRYSETEVYYKKALQMLPYYSYIYDNMGILKAAEKKPDSAEIYFNKAVSLNTGSPSVYFFYARFLHQQNQNSRAIMFLKKSLAISPSDIDSHYLLMEVYQDNEDWQELKDAANETLAIFPGDTMGKIYLESSNLKKSKIAHAAEYVKLHPSAASYVNLSLMYFNHQDYDSCINAAQNALKLDTVNTVAYNNIGSSYNALGEWGKAETAFEHVLKINPGFQLAKNNLNYSREQKKITEHMDSLVTNSPTPENYLNLSLTYYNQKQYLKTIDACKKAIALKPDFALAYNNLCSAYNNLKMWDDAIAAGEKAVVLEPNNQLAKNNLAFAIKSKAENSQKF